MNKFLTFFLSLLPLLGAMAAATQHFAEQVAYDAAFIGTPLFMFHDTPYYGPWKIFSWYFHFYRYVPSLFSIPMLYILGGLVAFFLLLFLLKEKAPLSSHGSAAWATTKQLRNMDLLSGSGIVVGMYDSGFTQCMTALFTALGQKKATVEAKKDALFFRKQETKRDNVLRQIEQLHLQMYTISKSSAQYKKLHHALEQKQTQLLPAQRHVSRLSGEYFLGLVYKTMSRYYANLPHTYLYDNSNRHLALVAPTRSGKGVGIIIPTLLGGWRESVVINDIKSENWGITAGYRKRMGQKVLKFEPTAIDGSSARWNPLDEIHIGTAKEVSTTQNLAGIIANYEGKKSADHWVANAGNVIFAVILHLKYVHYTDPEHYPTPPNLYTVASFLKAAAAPTMTEDGMIDDADIQIQDFIKAIQALQNYEHVPENGIEIEEWDDQKHAYIKRIFTPDDLHALYPDDFPHGTSNTPYTHPIVNKAFIEIAKKPPNELGSIISTACTALKEYLDPVLTENTRVSDFCVDDLMNNDKPVSLYLITPPSDLLRLSPLFRLFFEVLVKHHTERIGEYQAGRCKTLYKHRCLFLMDEFAALGNLQAFASTLAYIAGFGMKAF